MDFSDNKPIYQQIEEYAYSLILSGNWIPGERVPSVRELSAELTVNSRTVLKALEDLQARQVIVPRRGMGFFLADDAREKVLELRRREFFATTLPTFLSEMQMLGLTLDDIRDFESGL